MSNYSDYQEITRRLMEWEQGDDGALNRLFPHIFNSLKRRAAGIFREESGEDLLQATALVNELYLHLIEGNRISFKNRTHFFVVATRMMRRILVANARKRHTQRRGQNAKVPLDEVEVGYWSDPVTSLAVNKALKIMEMKHPRPAQVLELKVFGGLENHEIAAVLDTSLATIKRAWLEARKQLFLSLRNI